MPSTPHPPASTDNELFATWKRLSALPLGTRLFSWVMSRRVRYTGSIRPHILELAPGHARVELRDRAAVRNHLGSIHAVALMNLGEATGGLALMAWLPRTHRAIVTNLSMQYVKKARGTLTGRADLNLPDPNFEGHFVSRAELLDTDGDVVATCAAEWTLGLHPNAR